MVRNVFIIGGVVAVGLVLGITLLPTTTAMESLRACKSLEEVDVFRECFEASLPQALEKNGAAAVMEMLEDEYTISRCHDAGHLVGRKLFERSSSIENALQQCSFSCASACAHGVVGAAVASVPELRDAFTDLPHLNQDILRDVGDELCREREMCHAVGHLLYQLFGELDKSLAWCDSLAGLREPWSCYRGVFMENASANSSHIVVKGVVPPNLRDPQNLLYPCDVMPERYQPGCYHNIHMNQTMTLRERGIQDVEARAAEIIGACADAGRMKAPCYEGVGSYFALNQYSALDAISQCLLLTGSANMQACIFGYGYAMSAWGKTDEVLQMCEGLPNDDVRYACFESIADDLSVRPTHAIQGMCEATSDVNCRRAVSHILEGNPVRSVAR